MKKSELIRLLSSSKEDEVCVLIDGIQYDVGIEAEHIPEKFDGFFTAYPAMLGLRIKDFEE